MNKYFVLDVESMGLHGEPFSVGVTVVDEDGVVLEETLLVTKYSEAYTYTVDPPIDLYNIRPEPYKLVQLVNKDLEWVKANVPPMSITHQNFKSLAKDFWALWKKWKNVGARMVCDCPWPVESYFLRLCAQINEDPWGGPYPIIDVSSILFANNIDPTLAANRHTTELPAHNPLNDARQSARLFLKYVHNLNGILRRSC